MALVNWTGYQEPWTAFTQGDIYHAILYSYTIPLGIFFYYLILFLGLMLIYFKTENFGTTVVTGFTVLGFVSASTVTMSGVESGYPFIFGFVALFITYVLYKVFK